LEWNILAIKIKAFSFEGLMEELKFHSKAFLKTFDKKKYIFLCKKAYLGIFKNSTKQQKAQ
jgi:hypothetical protein